MIYLARHGTPIGWQSRQLAENRAWEMGLPISRHADTIQVVITAGAPSCLIVTGMPGAGKSTVTRLVAERLPRSARLDGDEMNGMTVGGTEIFDEEVQRLRDQARGRRLAELRKRLQLTSSMYPVLGSIWVRKFRTALTWSSISSRLPVDDADVKP